MLHEILVTMRKEFRGFFASPAAYVFLGGFLAVTLFIFFWINSFFTRNIADLRPMFAWMPIIMIFLSSALTMRAWAEERRAGTLELLLTAPARSFSLVMGKFLAIEALVALALAMTLPLALTVSMLGSFDWGPAIGGYVATLFLAASYIAIGLFVSARSDNPVISLIISVLVTSIFYLIGSQPLTELVERDLASLLSAIGAGARFESITRGVLDLRDLYYYISIVGIFLALNILQLHKLRWAGNPGNERHTTVTSVVWLTIGNLLVANFWLPSTQARVDLTESGRYTLSDVTRTTLKNLDEPLLIRGYFSSQTHPLLAPLVPQIRDLLLEYAIIGGERIHVEIANPTDDPQAEKSAAEAGIRPTPFQTASRYKSSVVSSYFDILISYGDERKTLGFRDLIEIKGSGVDDFEIGLANPEYVLTSAVRKVTKSYRSGGDPFASLDNVTFHGYISPIETMPEDLRPIHQILMTTLEELSSQNEGKFTYKIEDPDAGDGALAKRLSNDYGLSPQISDLLDPEPFWFSLRLESNEGETAIVLPDTGPFDEEAFKNAIKAAAKRLAPGFMRTVALATPMPQGSAPSMAMAPEPQYNLLHERLNETARLINADLSKGQITDEADILMVLAPTNIEKKELFAIDQFLMRGGAVILATSPYRINIGQSLSAEEKKSGLEDWLASLGVKIGEHMVLDPLNAALPIPIERTVGGLVFQEIRMLPYPHFPDIRSTGLSRNHPVTASLDQITLNWASPIMTDSAGGNKLTYTPLAWSSSKSWLSPEQNMVPNYENYPDTGFPVEGARASHTLAIAISGRFTSTFADENAPPSLQNDEVQEQNTDETQTPDDDSRMPQFDSVITRSPESAKLVVISSSGFASDAMLNLASQGLGTMYTRPIEFLQNVIDWAIEDPALLSLRGKTQFAHTLHPMTARTQVILEYLNYGFAALGLFLVWIWRRFVQFRDRTSYIRILSEVKA